MESLYAQWADLEEKRARMKTNPATQQRLKAATEKPGIADLMMEGMVLKVELDVIEKEQVWVEKQILAILSNPALGGAPNT